MSEVERLRVNDVMHLDYQGRQFRAVVAANGVVVQLEIKPICASVKNLPRWDRVSLGAKRSRDLCAAYGLRPYG